MKIIQYLFLLVIPFIISLENKSDAIDIELKLDNVYESRSMIGFLHSINETFPSDTLITELSPKYWRLGKNYEKNGLRLERISNTSQIIVLSDIIGYDTKYNYKNTARIDSIIQKLKYYYKDRQNKIIIDIWNEPNGIFFWKGSQSDFFEEFKLLHNKIRQGLGTDVTICGPSISKIDTTYLRNFFNYCRTNKLKVDLLSVHWFDSRINPNLFLESIKYIKANYIDSKDYQSVGLKDIIISEILNKHFQKFPSMYIASYALLEKSNVLGSCLACWENDNRESTCFNNSLDGIIDNKNNNVQSIWWALKRYSELTSTRYTVSSSNNQVIGIAGETSSGIKRVFISPIIDSVNKQYTISFKVQSNSDFNRHWNISVYCIKKGFSAPEFVLQKAVANNSRVELGFVADTDLIYIDLK